MTYLNITAYHFCLRFFIYFACTTLHTQLILLKKHATKRQNFEEIKRKKTTISLFCALFPSLCHYVHQTPLFWRTIPNLSGISSIYQHHLYGQKRVWYGKKPPPPFFPHFPSILSTAHCVQPNPPVLAHKQALNKEKSHPLFSSIWSKERLMWEKAGPFFLTFLFILNTVHHVQPNPPVLIHNGHL